MKKYETPVLIIYGNLKDVTKGNPVTHNPSQLVG